MDNKLPPYNRLRSLMTEGELTQRGSNNLDEILGVKKKENIFLSKIKKFFIKIDSLIFTKGSKTNNNEPHKRLK